MPQWVGVISALSLLVIAIAVAVVSYMIVTALIAAKESGASISKEVAQLRADIAPTLEAVKRLGEKGSEVAAMAETEAKEIIETTRRVRYDVERGLKRAKRRLADFDATVEVMQEEIDETVIKVSEVLESARSGVGMVNQLRRLVRPRRRGAA